MSEAKKIRIWDRQAGQEAVEQIYGDAMIRLVYERKVGQWIGPIISEHAGLSKAYGWLQSQSLSRLKVPGFVRRFGIPMEEYEEKSYSSFNDFFIRRFKSGKRPFAQGPNEFSAFCEGRYFAFNESRADLRLSVKGAFLSPLEVIADEVLGNEMLGGPCAVARLCPVDYHRYHFPDSGTIERQFKIPGLYHSVNPLALDKYPRVFLVNEREVTVLNTDHFGKIVLVDVGAICVGKIVQSHKSGHRFERGDEKGYFLFGGSTTIVFGQPGAWKWDSDLTEKTERGMESLVRLGEKMGQVTQ